MSRGSARARFILGRLGRSVVVIVGILLMNFILLHLAPGDVVSVLAGESGGADEGYLKELRASFGLDRPLPLQFVDYSLGLLRLDLGWSFRNSMPVSALILGRLPATLLLTGFALGIAILLGIVLGVMASRRPNSVTDNVISVFSLLAYATPMFWLGLMLVVLFSLKLGWLPTSGFSTIGADLSPLGAVLDVAKHAALPVMTLALFYAAIYTRLMRASMLEVSGLDFVRTAIAKGLSERRVRYTHVLRNALLPIVTMVGIQFGTLFGGAVVVEMVFNWPGLGRLAYEAIMGRDLNVLLGILFLSSILVVFINIVMDIVYVMIDPRIEVS